MRLRITAVPALGCFVLGCFVLAPGGTAQDSVQLLDGTFVLDKKMTRTADGVVVHFDNGDVLIREARIQSTTARQEDADEELSEGDREKIARGQVRDPDGRFVTQRVADRRYAAIRKAREETIAVNGLRHRLPSLFTRVLPIQSCAEPTSAAPAWGQLKA